MPVAVKWIVSKPSSVSTAIWRLRPTTFLLASQPGVSASGALTENTFPMFPDARREAAQLTFAAIVGRAPVLAKAGHDIPTLEHVVAYEVRRSERRHSNLMLLSALLNCRRRFLELRRERLPRVGRDQF